MRDDEDGKQNPDSDHAAILARRKRFVALTLSGLATTACTNGGDRGGDRGGDQGDKQDTKTEPRQPEIPPQVCLSPMPPKKPLPDSVPPPHPCLKIAAPDSGTETGETETGAVEEPPPPPAESKPRPCLRKASPEPRPCLKMAPPADE